MKLRRMKKKSGRVSYRLLYYTGLIVSGVIAATMVFLNVQLSLKNSSSRRMLWGPEKPSSIKRNIKGKPPSARKKTTVKPVVQLSTKNFAAANVGSHDSFPPPRVEEEAHFDIIFDGTRVATMDMPKQLLTKREPDHNQLHYEKLANKLVFERKISSNDTCLYEQYRERILGDSGPPVGEPIYDNNPDLDEAGDCRRQSWASLRFPTCNALHEIVFDRPRSGYLQDYSYFLAGAGQHRGTYIFEKTDGTSFAMKALMLDSWSRTEQYIIPIEALIMERLTHSPYITNIYSYCGTTTIMESLRYEVADIIQPGRGRASQEDLDKLDNVYSKNKLTPLKRVGIALDMAESLAELHGFSDGVIVHGDNHINQFLADDDGIMRLGDFNLVSILEWNDKKGEYCKRERVPWAYQYRAPEEIGGIPFDEKIDVFSLGNSIYSLITGLDPFYDQNRAKIICAKILNGTRAFVDPRYRNRNQLETRLLEILDLVWEHDADKRVDIFTVVNYLRRLRDSKDVTALDTQNGN